MNPLANPSYLLPPLLAALLSGFLCFLVARHARGSPTHRYFAVFLLALSIWSSLIYLMRSSPDTGTALVWERMLIPLMIASAPAFYYFTVAYYPAGAGRGTLVAAIIYLAAIAVMTPTGLLVEHMELRDYGYAPIFGLPFYPLALFAYIWMAAGMVNIYRAYRASRVYEERNRLLYILIATSFPLVGSALDILPSTYPTGVLGNLAFGTLTTVAMRKYHLLDISLVVRKGLAYLVTSTVVALPYVLLIYLAIYLFNIKQVWPLLYIPLLIFLALGLQPLWRIQQEMVDRLFFRRRWDYVRALEEFSRHTRTVTELEKLASDLVELVRRPLQVDGAALLLPTEAGDFVTVAASGKLSSVKLGLERAAPLISYLGKREEPLECRRLDLIPQLQALTQKDRSALEAAGAELLIPLRLRERLSGVLVLGAKLAESPYSGEDLRLLSMFAAQTAVVLDDSRLFALQRAQLEQLRELDQAKSYFFLTLAHHLKTPVTAIKASAELLADVDTGNQTPAGKRLVAALLRSSATLEKTIAGVLELVRIRTAALEVEPEPADVPELLRQIARMFEPTLQLKEQTLELELPESFPQAYLDSRRFEQILVNLLDNAQKFTPRGGRLWVTLKQSGGFLTVAVRDSGPGIPEDERERIFEPFYMGKTGAHEPGGSGLGLSIARSLVEFLGGKVWLESKLEQGSTFAFSLPLVSPPPRPSS